MAFRHLNGLKFYYKTECKLQIKYTTGFALLSCQLGKIIECKTILFIQHLTHFKVVKSCCNSKCVHALKKDCTSTFLMHLTHTQAYQMLNLLLNKITPLRYSPHFWLWTQSCKPTITVWSHYVSTHGNVTFSKVHECQWDLTHKSFKSFEIIYYIWTFSEGHSVTRTMFALLPMKDKSAVFVLTRSRYFQGFSYYALPVNKPKQTN